ncbi:MAG TPA: alpha/beta hydrolase [Gammaproteobacteria bacterium]|nr:alpha/beta hydrolase [Gammaproteobacteria bacterium]
MAGGNFLVRSAHLIAQQGYRVITIDRPGDYVDYNVTHGYDYDPYRTSMDHAVDITTVINRHNTENIDVIIAGTSRGAISAAANNTLGAGIFLSSPVTSGNGTPVGSASLPVSTIQVPVYLLYNVNDGCSTSTPEGSVDLFKALVAAGTEISGDAVSGGFYDTVENQPCRGKSYHSFLGIESCAVSKITGWADSLLTNMQNAYPDNKRPVAQDLNISVTAGSSNNPFTISATDLDTADTLTYSVPYNTTVLGGTVTLNADGNGSYTPPSGASGDIEDSFVFVVSDGKGGTSSAVVRATVGGVI